ASSSPSRIAWTSAASSPVCAWDTCATYPGGTSRARRLVVGMRRNLVEADRLVARIAARQHGVISVRQLHAAGLDSAAIARRVTRGLLHRIHRGVYAVGHRGLTARGRWKAATLACGEGAVLSHRSAAELWGML